MPAFHVSKALWLCTAAAWPAWRVSADGQPNLLLRGGKHEESVVQASSGWLVLPAVKHEDELVNDNGAVYLSKQGWRQAPRETCDVDSEAVYPDYRPQGDNSMTFVGVLICLWGTSIAIIWRLARNMLRNVAQASDNRASKKTIESGGRSRNAADATGSGDPDATRSTQQTRSSGVERGGDGLVFPDHVLEEKWLAESEEELLQRGFAMLAFMSLTMCAIRTGGWLYWLLSGQGELCGLFGIFFPLLRAIILIGIFTGSLLAAKNPMAQRNTYYGFVIFYSFFIPAQNSPPFTLTCWTLHRVIGELRAELGEYYDCSLQGTTASMYFLSFILTLPWIVPRFGMMKLIWVWLVLMYLGGALIYLMIFGKPGWLTAGNLPQWSREPTPGGVLCGFCWMSIALAIASQKKWFLEKAFRNRTLSTWSHMMATKKMYKILSFMIPEHVIIDMLRNPGEPIAKPIDKVSILFLEIEKFDEFSGNRRPKVVLAFLNKLFNQMEEICHNFEVTKIETWGHEFVACVGNSPADEAITKNQGHHVLVERMMLAGAEFLRLQTTELEFRIGVHTGPIVAGVVGHKLPRYRLFGDTINTAARQMQKSSSGMLQFGEETKIEVEKVGTLEYNYNGEVMMKGKGKLKTYILNAEATQKSNEANKRSFAAAKVLKSQTSCLHLDMLGVAALSPTFWRAVGTFKHKLRQSKSVTNTLMRERDNTMSSARSMFDEQSVDGKQLARNNEFAEVMRSANADIEDDNLDQFLKEMMQSESQGAFQCFRFRSAFFTNEMEDKWITWHFETTICKKLTHRMGRISLAMIGLTFLEAMYINGVHLAAKDKVVSISMVYGQRGIAVFSLARLGALLISLSWWHLVSSKEKMIRARPRQILKVMVASCWVQALLMYICYDALLLHRDELVRGDPRSARPMEQTFGAVLYALQYFLISRTHEFLARHQIVFMLGGFFICWGYPRMTSMVGGFSPRSLYSRDGCFLFVFLTILCWMLAHDQEQESRTRFRAIHARTEMKERSEKALKTLMPELVVKELTSLAINAPLPTHVYRHATIAQSDLCGFTDLAKDRPPTEVVVMISDLFGRFDRASDERDIYKVETVGDAYIAGMAEAPLTEKNSPAAVIMFGLDMIKEVHKWSESINAGVRCRVGIHYGECIGGVVGYEMQRYHLFGPLMNYIEVLESTGEPSRVQISQACKEEVERQLDSDAPDVSMYKSQIVGFIRRESETLTTSKGGVHHYDEVGGRTFFVHFKESPTWPP